MKAYPGDYTWEDARVKCSQDGTGAVKAELAVPRDFTESEWFANKATELGLGIFWLGLNDIDVEGTWTDTQGRTQIYFNWAAGQPSGGGQHCATSGGQWGSGWDDDGCSVHDTFGQRHLLCTYVEGISNYFYNSCGVVVLLTSYLTVFTGFYFIVRNSRTILC